MKPFRILLALAVAALLWAEAQAAVLVAVSNQETPVPIHTALGTILQLPSAVKTVTPSQFFVIRDVGGGAGGGKADVRTFHVKPAPGAKAEAVTFVLASGRALALKLLPTPNADKFVDIQSESISRKRDGKFLGPEMLMMRAMLTDEPGGFRREVTEEPVDSPFPDLTLTLTRLYAAEGLTGYVFQVRHNGREPLAINLSGLGFARPNRAVLSQADRLRLEPCPILGTSETCETTLRLVVQGPKPVRPLLGEAPGQLPPFARPSQLQGGEP